MTLVYGSVCSGIEAATVAWEPLGWEPSFFSEIDPFPRAVLMHRFPSVSLHGDFTTIQAGDYAAIHLLVGGTPCQSFSVAGLRGGLADERGNLALEYLRLALRLRPRWLVWENVPGVLSSDGGRDFGAILGGMVELGYGFAYRVLDAQYFGVPQRRRRVFVVGYLGNWRPAAAVLFERHSLQGHPPPRRKARQDPAGTLAGGARSRGGFSYDDVPLTGEVSVAPTLNAGTGRRRSPRGDTGDPIVAVTGGGPESGQIAGTVSAKWAKGTGGPAGDECYNLVAFNPVQDGMSPGEVCPPNGASTGFGNQCAVAFHGAQDPDVSGSVTHPVGRNHGQETCALVGAAVRRLTPRECERLQGFPDDWTLIPLTRRQRAAGSGRCGDDRLLPPGLPAGVECGDRRDGRAP